MSTTPTAAPTSTGTVRTHKVSATGNWLLRHALFMMLLVFVVAFAIASPRFGSLGNARVILLTASTAALLAFGQAFVILTAGIDLSVGSLVGLTGVVAAIAATQYGGSIQGVIAGVLVGVLAGLFNGIVVAFLRVPPFIVTLGMMTIALGLGQLFSNGSPVSNLPVSFEQISSASLGGIPVPVIVMIVAFAVSWLVLARTRFGMSVYAVGGNPLAARIAGIKGRRVLMAVYTISGLFAGVAGVILAAQATAGIATTGTGYELDAIAAVVIGGISLMGGRGSMVGALIGVLIIATLNNGLDILNVSPFFQDVVKGVLIIAAVYVDVRFANSDEA